MDNRKSESRGFVLIIFELTCVTTDNMLEPIISKYFVKQFHKGDIPDVCVCVCA